MPTALSGDAVIFDYRTLHRGTANNGDRPRAMLELVFFRRGYSDLLNFPKRSVMNVTSVPSEDELNEGEGS